ncbi:unnamed protein product [Nezara viridula]|uniref:Uncharacterized protein n=1 Tax=Nezara viridula TaxID=85310 RepID=A0A9P0E0L0_NEZVI|nr:unnamed protein product [Nezara viridula]
MERRQPVRRSARAKIPRIDKEFIIDDSESGLSEDKGEPLKRTKGKKMSYLEVAGSDTEEGVIARSRKLISEDEEGFVPEKEEVREDEENEPEEVEPVEEVQEVEGALSIC